MSIGTGSHYGREKGNHPNRSVHRERYTASGVDPWMMDPMEVGRGDAAAAREYEHQAMSDLMSDAPEEGIQEPRKKKS